MKKVIYEHKLVIGKNADIEIKIRENNEGKSELAMSGSTVGHGGQCQDTLREIFNKNPENLYISKKKFDKLMESWDNWHLKSPVPEDVMDFVKSVKTSPENEMIEDNLESHDSFSVKVNGQTLFLDSSLKGSRKDVEYGGEHNVYNVKYRIDESETVRSFKFNDSVHNYNQGKESLSRRDVLSAFECILTDAISGDTDFEDFKANYCEDDDCGMDLEIKKKNKKLYADCQKAKSDLEDINDLYEFNDAFQEGEDTDFTGWVVEDAEVKKSSTLTLKM